MVKKTFFKNRTEAQIRNLSHQERSGSRLVSKIKDLPEDTSLVITRKLIPESYKTASKFKKHGREMTLKRAQSAHELREGRVAPIKFREEAFNDLQKEYQKTGNISLLSGYTFRPPKGVVDQVLRKVALVSCLDAAQLVAYANQVPGADMPLKDYDDSKISAIEGGNFVVQVPSRTKKHSRWDVGLEGVAVLDNDWKYVVAQSIDSDHACGEKRYNRELRFKNLPNRGKERAEKSKVIQFCPHDIAAYMTLVNKYWNQDKNLVPLVSSQFAIPTQETVDFYQKLRNNTLVEYETKSGKVATRSMNQAELETMLWGLVAVDGHDKTFFATKDIKEYNWRIPGEK